AIATSIGGAGGTMITPAPGARVWFAAGFTDMRKGFDGLAMLVQEKLKRDPFCGQISVFRAPWESCDIGRLSLKIPAASASYHLAKPGNFTDGAQRFAVRLS